jgi:peroxiredoxin
VTARSGTATVGTKAPDFELAGPDGTRFRLSEATASGPVVVVFLRGFA